MKALTILAFLLVVGLCISSQANATRDIYLEDQVGLGTALRTGNLSHLKTINKTAQTAWTRKIARLGYLESNRRLSTLSKEATACFKSSKRGKVDLNQVKLVLSCGIFSATAAKSELKIAEWARMASETENYVIPALQKLKVAALMKLSPKTAFTLPYFYGAEVKGFVNVPAAVVKHSQHKTKAKIPWQRCLPKRVNGVLMPPKMATIRVQVNHKPVCFAVDTGAPFSVLTEKAASLVGAKIYPGTYRIVRSRVSSKDISAKLGIVRHFKLGSITISNAPFEIQKGGVNLIGNDILQQLGRVLFTEKGLVINPKHFHTGCNQPMAYGYNPQTLISPLGPVFSVFINHKHVRALFDSGQAAPLFTDSKKYLESSKPPFGKREHLSGLHYSMTSYSTKALLSFGDSEPHTVRMTYAPGYESYIHVRFGFGVLEHYNVLLDFDNHTACVMPASST
jgi:hypothetical protein